MRLKCRLLPDWGGGGANCGHWGKSSPPGGGAFAPRVNMLYQALNTLLQTGTLWQHFRACIQK